MTDVIFYRGPDGEGFYIHKNLALGHRRLSIIDLNTGDQPMFNDDNSIALIFNGEIYNYIELREELNFFDYCFKTNSNTEPIIKAYQHWGIEYMSNADKDIKLHHFERKTILRKTIGLKLPWAILHAPKRGFVVPIREWFKEDSFTEILYNFEKTIPYLNKNKISKSQK
jgi:asparagine synthetase B (glutamine-hydrolysing)